MNSYTEIDVLRTTVTLDSQPMTARQNAATLVVKLVHDGVPAPADSDLEVLKLTTPKDRSKETDDQRNVNDLLAKMLGNTALGLTVAKAKSAVHDRHRLHAVLALIVDEGVHRLIRLAACLHILDSNPQIGLWAKNGYSASKLLDTVVPAGSLKYTSRSIFDGPMQVERPPLVLADVWEL